MVGGCYSLLRGEPHFPQNISSPTSSWPHLRQKNVAPAGFFGMAAAGTLAGTLAAGEFATAGLTAARLAAETPATAGVTMGTIALGAVATADAAFLAADSFSAGVSIKAARLGRSFSRASSMVARSAASDLREEAPASRPSASVTNPAINWQLCTSCSRKALAPAK